MEKEHSIAIPVGALQKALTTIFPQQSEVSETRPSAVTLKYDQREKHLSLEEARHGHGEYTIPAEGAWPEKIQVNGVLLKRLCNKLSSNDIIELIPLRDSLCLLVKNLRVVLKRLDLKPKPDDLLKEFARGFDFNESVQQQLNYYQMLALADMLLGWALGESCDAKRTAWLTGISEGLLAEADQLGPDWFPPEPEEVNFIGWLGQVANGDPTSRLS